MEKREKKTKGRKKEFKILTDEKALSSYRFCKELIKSDSTFYEEGARRGTEAGILAAAQEN